MVNINYNKENIGNQFLLFGFLRLSVSHFYSSSFII